MKSRSLQNRSRSYQDQKKPLRKRRREYLEGLTSLIDKILKQEENIDTLRKERSQLNLSEDHDSE